ncbi:hypothetical protein M422DRAFT_271177 [Sphaerobolus stellatus SS14]|uniref:Uncharacterized protein n=1 Tax=Sphaerobolus stellatus (strain SS14) TaxID=990650 RepID=A0A0C9TEC5_SPHS4|nr:hypothetical protein M422DRAFT_271177 [Sphaerobolus stellatus SS14]
MLSLPKRMAPTLEPPPSTAASSISTPHAGSPSTSIDTILKNRHTLILSIALPKTKNAKKIAPFHLKPSTNHIGLSTDSKLSLSKNPSKSNNRDTRCDITLAQVDHSNSVLLSLSNEEIINEVHDAIRESNTVYEATFVDYDGEDRHYIPYIRGVGRHRSGDIRLSCRNEEDRDLLIKHTSKWIAKLSTSLKLSLATFPVVAHGFPTSFDPSHDSPETANFLYWNEDIIPHPTMEKLAPWSGFLM